MKKIRLAHAADAAHLEKLAVLRLELVLLDLRARGLVTDVNRFRGAQAMARALTAGFDRFMEREALRERIRAKLSERRAERARRAPPDPAPRYDRVYFEGVQTPIALPPTSLTEFSALEDFPDFSWQPGLSMRNEALDARRIFKSVVSRLRAA